MNNEHVKGGMKQVKGRIKEEVGHLTGNNKMEAEGVLGRVMGKIQEGLGDAKDAVKHGVDSVLNPDGKKKS